MSVAAQADEPSPGRVVTKAAFRAANRLGLSSRALARCLGVSEATASRIRHGTYTLEPDSKPFELAVLLIRVFRSLDAIVGGDAEVAKAWMRNDNRALQGVPKDLVTSVSGLTHVLAYLDARRARA